MSILGNLVDIRTASRVGDDLAGLTLATFAHSLPATNPEVVIPVLRSIEDTAEDGGMLCNPAVFGLGGNASILTVGYHAGSVSAVSFGTIMFDLLAIVFHSAIR